MYTIIKVSIHKTAFKEANSLSTGGASKDSKILAGLHAIFQLENGFDINSGKAGQGGAEFGPEAFVGLTSDSYGTIIAGCQNDTFQDLVYGVQSNYLYYFTAHGDEDNADRTARNSNDLERQSERRIR